MRENDQNGLDAAMIMRMATGYLARYSASTHRLRQVLERRVKRWHDTRKLPHMDASEVASLLDEVVRRLNQIGLLDDTAFAVARTERLVHKGLPRARVRLALAAEGIDPRQAELDAIMVDDEAAQARRFAARKRLGPFRSRSPELYRDKDIRSLIRAGFSPRHAIAVVDGEGNQQE
ncbi:RecX family transcriptional regulator [Lichenifustis flavocetrariae]|nr:RecX family transcriptional regulator [Lichenifustis flavocetrariae]